MGRPVSRRGGPRKAKGEGWSAAVPVADIDALSADDPARVDAYVEHWFWSRDSPGAPSAEVAAPCATPWPAGGEPFPRTVLRGLLLELRARLRDADAGRGPG